MMRAAVVAGTGCSFLLLCYHGIVYSTQKYIVRCAVFKRFPAVVLSLSARAGGGKLKPCWLAQSQAYCRQTEAMFVGYHASAKKKKNVYESRGPRGQAINRIGCSEPSLRVLIFLRGRPPVS